MPFKITGNVIKGTGFVFGGVGGLIIDEDAPDHNGRDVAALPFVGIGAGLWIAGEYIKGAGDKVTQPLKYVERKILPEKHPDNVFQY